MVCAIGGCARDVDGGVAWGPEDDADAEVRVAHESMAGEAGGFIMQNIRFDMMGGGAGAEAAAFLEGN